MKKLTIGRHNSCDIIIPDTTDIVSRKQAVLEISFWGKMKIHDTSNNGTFVNGERLSNGSSRVITRADKVNFGRVADLDWSKVPDPYRKQKVWSVAAIVCLFIAFGILAWWLTRPVEEDRSIGVEDIEVVVPSSKDSVEDVTPKPVITRPAAPRRVAAPRKTVKRTPVPPTSAPKPVKKEEKREETTKEHAPLVY